MQRCPATAIMAAIHGRNAPTEIRTPPEDSSGSYPERLSKSGPCGMSGEYGHSGSCISRGTHEGPSVGASYPLLSLLCRVLEGQRGMAATERPERLGCPEHSFAFRLHFGISCWLRKHLPDRLGTNQSVCDKPTEWPPDAGAFLRPTPASERWSELGSRPRGSISPPRCVGTSRRGTGRRNPDRP